MNARLKPLEFVQHLKSIPLWRKSGRSILRIFEFPDFPDAIAFVNKVARHAEKAQHHPDIDIRWNKVTLRLTTHDADGLTLKDVHLAAIIDDVARGQSPLGQSPRAKK